MKKFSLVQSGLLALTLAAFIMAGNTASAQFTNGGFEDGTLTGWNQGYGYWYGGAIDPSTYLNGITSPATQIVTPGFDPVVGSKLNQVYNGNYAVRVNNSFQDYSVSAISQTVHNYTDTHIYFDWAAVLESSHGPADSDNFSLKLTDDTKNLTLYSVQYNSASNGPIFSYLNGWYYTDWQVQDLDVSQYLGDTFTLSLLASDCPYGGHAGYVYLDGFRSTVSITTGAVPEPSTYGMIGASLLLVCAMLRRRFAKR